MNNLNHLMARLFVEMLSVSWLCLAVATVATVPSAGSTELNVRAWQQAVAGSTDYTYPEMELPEVKAKTSTAICFTGQVPRTQRRCLCCAVLWHAHARLLWARCSACCDVAYYGWV